MEPIVPIIPVFLLSASKILLTKYVMEVFPLVPVTPISSSSFEGSL